RFSPRRVFLNAGDVPEQQSFSNILVDGSIQWSPKWGAEASLAYDQRNNRVAQGRIGMRYMPGPYRVISANLSRQLDGYEQVDAGWQWPLNDLWGDRGKDLTPGRGLGGGRLYSVGRAFYSIKERRVTDMLLGLEYDSCCWIGRIGWRRQQTQTLPRVVNNSVMVQVEFVGLTRVGTSALSTFRKNIPGYTPLRQPDLYQRSRFERYD
ncbi:MAG: LPS assembly protein LptD, partial [Brachymonas sp.]|nr:LPS assembly protein LptD [Brachymonas sp.]